MNPSALTELRQKIDAIDAKIVALLNERFDVVSAVGKYKKEHHLPVLDAGRENQVLAQLDALNQGLLPSPALHAIYREIMAGARALEHTVPTPETGVIYLDHAAAAPVLPEVLSVMGEAWETNFANPEAAHSMGGVARKVAKAAAAELWNALLPGRIDAEPAIIWGGGASELIAAIGLALGDKRKSVWGSYLDHPAAQAMQKRAFASVHRMKIDRFARLEALVDDGEPAPALGFFTWVQSEVGTVLNPERLAEFRALFPDSVLVLDAVQGAGKIAYSKEAPLPDVMIVSGHKFGAPGGGALLFSTKRGRRLAERFAALREPEYMLNRVDPAQTQLLALAAQVATAGQPEKLARVAELAQSLREMLDGKMLPNGKKLRLTIPEKESSPYIVHCTLPGYQSGVLVRMLAEKGVMVSAGSACQSETDQPSAVLTAMGMNRELVWSGLRISLSLDTTKAELQKFVSALGSILETY